MSLEEVLKKLRYVKRWPDPESEIRHQDHDTKLEALIILRDILKERIGEDPLVDQLDEILRLIPYVKAGDIVEPEHHNLIVDALWTVRDILEKMETVYKALIEAVTPVFTYFSLKAPIPPISYTSLVVEFTDVAFEDKKVIIDESGIERFVDVAFETQKAITDESHF
jgi:hypothetical protein